jgi:hypothetical protein
MWKDAPVLTDALAREGVGGHEDAHGRGMSGPGISSGEKAGQSICTTMGTLRH